MRIDIQYKIKENEYYLRYLRENSHWYKFLNRTPNNFRDFSEEAKHVYKLTRADRISKTLETIEMMEIILSTLK